MWKLWIMWIIQWKNKWAAGEILEYSRKKPRRLKMWKEILCKLKNPHSQMEVIPNWNVDNVDNYFPKRCSPTWTMSPAPIVINKSPLIQFFKRKFSISSNDGK